MANRGRGVADMALGENGDYWMKFDDGPLSRHRPCSEWNRVRCWKGHPLLWFVKEKRMSWCVSAEFDRVMSQEKPMLLHPKGIRYTNDFISLTFQDGESQNTMRQLRVGCLIVDEIPSIRVVKDTYDNWWSLDNRRLWCFKTCGLDSIRVFNVHRNTNFWLKKNRLIGNGWNVKFNR